MRGCLISLIGSDGTGKSSITELLKRRFEKEHGKTSLFYMGSLNHVLITSRILYKLSSFNKQRNLPEQNDAVGLKKPRLSFISFIKELTFLHYIVELFARYFIWIRPKIKKGEVVITDRYIYDFLIIDRLLNNYGWFRNFIIRIIPSPDLLVCLYNDPDIILKRKKDNSEEEIMRQNKIFLSLGQHIRTFKKFKTDGTVEEITEKIFAETENVMVENDFIQNHDKENIEYALACRLLELMLIEESQRPAYFKEKIDMVFTVGQTYKIARFNNVIMRLGKIINNMGDSAIISRWEDILRMERERCEKSVNLARVMPKSLEDDNIGYAVIKTLDNYPDFGADVDMFIAENFKTMKDWIQKKHRGAIRQRKISEVLCGKMTVDIPGYSRLEFHCDRMGQVGEQPALAESIIKNRRLFEADDIKAYIPSLEDQVIILTIHRLYRHLNFKTADIVNAITLLKNKNFNWEYLFKFSERLGIKEGIRYLLGIMENVHISYFREGFLPKDIKILMYKKNELFFRHYFFRIPLFKVPIKLYGCEFNSYLKRGNIDSILRLSLIPILSALSYLSIKFFKDEQIW